MSGLEASEIRLTEIIKDNDRFRFDAEYFKKEYLNSYNMICALCYKKIKDVIFSLTDFHSNGSYEDIAKNYKLLDKPSYAYMIRTTDLETKNYFDNVKYIDEVSYNFLSKSKVYGGEVVINKIGCPGKTYYIPHLKIPMSLGMNLFMLKANSIINNEYLFIYLNSKYGSKIIERNINGAVPLSIDKEAIKNLPIPIFSDEFTKMIAKKIYTSEDLEAQSSTLYSQASDLLLSELGLKDFNPSNENISIKTLKDSFLKTGRLDSEYYQIKYEEIESKIKTYGSSKLFNFVESYTTGFPYTSDTYVSKDGIPLIKIGNMNDITVDLSNATLIPKSDLSLSEENIIQRKDILISMSGTIGSSCIIEETIQAVVNQRIMKLKSKNINPYVLVVIMNCIIGKLQLERVGTGGVQTNISPNDILNIDIPIIREDVQNEVASYIKESISYSKQAKKLLKEAVDSVEKAIENNVGGGYNA